MYNLNSKMHNNGSEATVDALHNVSVLCMMMMITT